VHSSTYNDEEETLKANQSPYPPNPKPSFNPKRAQKQTTNPSMPNLDGVYICMFCSHAGHLDEFCFRCKRLEKKHVDYARNSYRDEFFDFPPRSHSRALPNPSSRAFLISLVDLTITHMVLVHKRTTLCLDTLVMNHVLIVVIISHIGLVFLLEGLALTLSRDT
jgi:hypothetical protein